MRRLLLCMATLSLAACNDPKFDHALTLGGATVEPETLKDGYDAYMQYCRPCHGDKGDGHGYSAVGLRPPPRDFSQSLFKFGGVAAPGLPPDSELKRIVKKGLHGTAMLPWDITDQELDATLQYMKTFPRHAAEEQAKVTGVAVDPQWKSRWESEKPGEPVHIADPNLQGDKRAQAIALGRAVYHGKAQCSAACHPNFVTHQELYDIAKGMGNELTEFAPDMYVGKAKDSEYCLVWKEGWKKLDDRECALPAKVMPVDFIRDDVRAGDSPEDLYRTIGGGVSGAGMPPWKGVLSDDELWGLSYYVHSLVELKGTPAGKQLQAKLADPANMAWKPAPKAPPPEEKPAEGAKKPDGAKKPPAPPAK